MRRITTALATYQACYTKGRTDQRGSEEGKPDRPWLVLSDQDLHDHNVFIACSITSAPKRESRCYLTQPAHFLPLFRKRDGTVRKEPSYIDLQQLWTFPRESDATGHLHSLIEAEREELLRLLGGRLQHQKVRTLDPSTGDVIRIRLLDGRDRDRSDLTALHSELDRLGIPWRPGDVTIPALVVASDVPERQRGKYTYQLLTAVPLVADDVLLADQESPRLAVPGTSPQEFLAPITSLLFTVDYRDPRDPWIRRNGLPDPYTDDVRVFRTAWRATDNEVAWTLKDIRSLLQVPPHVQSST